MDSHLSLKWQNHGIVFLKLISDLLSTDMFCDATIVCFGKYYQAHKLVLSTCSEYFKDIFDQIKCNNPVLIINEIKPSEMEALLNFMYKGEVIIKQESVTSLIRAAESLKIKGLAVPPDAVECEKSPKKRRSRSTSPVPESKQIKVQKKNDETLETRLSEFSPLSYNQTSIKVSHQSAKKYIPYHDHLKDPSVLYPEDEAAIQEMPSIKIDIEDHEFNEESQQVLNDNDAMQQLRNQADPLKLNESHESSGSHESSQLSKSSEPLNFCEMVEQSSIKIDIEDLEFKVETQPVVFDSDVTQQLREQPDDIQFDKHQETSQFSENCEITEQDKFPVDDQDSSSEYAVQDYSSDSSYEESRTLRNSAAKRFKRKCKRKKQSINLILKQCFFCSFQSDRSLLFHIKSSHPDKTIFVCPFCSFLCVNRRELDVHVDQHAINDSFVCLFCKFQSNSKELLSIHMKTHVTSMSENSPYTCPYCTYQSFRKGALTSHIKYRCSARTGDNET